MASNLIVKLLLEDKDFAGKFKKNREAVLSFNNVGNTMLGVVGKFAGAFGLAMGGAEAFNKAIVYAMQTLSGKSMKELIEEAAKEQETQGNGQSEGKTEEVKKKKQRGSIMMRLRRIWSAIVD
jgi:hypothetical protein